MVFVKPSLDQIVSVGAGMRIMGLADLKFPENSPELAGVDDAWTAGGLDGKQE